jgi:CheY-like chemotaxis protein
MLPWLKVLFTSGYTQNAIVHGGRLDPGVELLSKPYSREQLAHKIRHVLGVVGDVRTDHERSEVPRCPVDPAVARDAPREVLVVDDDSASLDAVCELLTMAGYLPDRAGDAQAALKSLQARPFDVLITDVALPDISGVELARQATTLHPGINIIFASGNAMSEREDFGFRWTALRKPFSTDALLAAIRSTRKR